MVIKVNDINQQKRSGSTAHHPRWAIAYKFKARQAKGKLYHVTYQVGRTGAITPVAKVCHLDHYAKLKRKSFDKIDEEKVLGLPLAGVEVKNVSLHNEEFIAEKDLKIGDTVIVERAGDVIPYVVGPVKEDRTGKEKVVEFPTHCPTCNTRLEKPEGEAVWRCPNTIGCASQIEEGLIHYVSKGALDIDGFGREIVKKFMTLGYI